MATLTYQVTYGDWSGTINLIYTTKYDPATNSTTVTFAECNAVYSSRADYQTTTDTNITVTAGDNTGSSGTATLATSGYGTGGEVTFTGTPSPSSITIQHSSGAGEKTVSLSASTTAAVRPYSGSDLVYAGGSGSASLTSAVQRTLNLNKGNGTNLEATLYASTLRSTGINLTDGSAIFDGEVVRVYYSAEIGYSDIACNVSGIGSVGSGGTFTVSQNHTVTTSATRLQYTLTLVTDEHSILSVTRSNVALSNGATIFYGDVLTIAYSPDEGYEITTATLNGASIESPHTVTEAVLIVVETAKTAAENYIYIGNEAYAPFIHNGEAWEQYIACIGNGSGFDVCS